MKEPLDSSDDLAELKRLRALQASHENGGSSGDSDPENEITQVTAPPAVAEIPQKKHVLLDSASRRDLIMGGVVGLGMVAKALFALWDALR